MPTREEESMTSREKVSMTGGEDKLTTRGEEELMILDSGMLNHTVLSLTKGTWTNSL